MVDPPPETRTVRSFCRICTAVCGILVEVEGDRVVRVRGDRDHPMSCGYTCAKGRALPAMHHHPDRLERPLMRIDGQLQPVTWEACLDDLGGRLRAVIGEHGPLQIGFDQEHATVWKVLSDGHGEPNAQGGLALTRHSAAHRHNLGGKACASSGIDASKELVAARK